MTTKPKAKKVPHSTQRRAGRTARSCARRADTADQAAQTPFDGGARRADRRGRIRRHSPIRRLNSPTPTKTTSIWGRQRSKRSSKRALTGRQLAHGPAGGAKARLDADFGLRRGPATAPEGHRPVPARYHAGTCGAGGREEARRQQAAADGGQSELPVDRGTDRGRTRPRSLHDPARHRASTPAQDAACSRHGSLSSFCCRPSWSDSTSTGSRPRFTPPSRNS